MNSFHISVPVQNQTLIKIFNTIKKHTYTVILISSRVRFLAPYFHYFCPNPDQSYLLLNPKLNPYHIHKKNHEYTPKIWLCQNLTAKKYVCVTDRQVCRIKDTLKTILMEFRNKTTDSFSCCVKCDCPQLIQLINAQEFWKTLYYTLHFPIMPTGLNS